MSVRKIWGYREFHGDRISWKIGDLSGDDSYDKGSGQFSFTLDININSGTFKTYTPKGVRPWKILSTFLDHSICLVVWNWGIWIAVRGKEL